MRRQFLIISTCSFSALLPLMLFAAEPIHHDLKVTLYPEKHGFKAWDTITLSPEAPVDITVSLHAGLDPSSSTPGVRIVREKEVRGARERRAADRPPGLVLAAGDRLLGV